MQHMWIFLSAVCKLNKWIYCWSSCDWLWCGEGNDYGSGGDDDDVGNWWGSIASAFFFFSVSVHCTGGLTPYTVCACEDRFGYSVLIFISFHFISVWFYGCVAGISNKIIMVCACIEKAKVEHCTTGQKHIRQKKSGNSRALWAVESNNWTKPPTTNGRWLKRFFDSKTRSLCVRHTK